MDENYFLFLLLAFVSEVIGTVSGFGSSILFVPLASLFFDFKSVLGITAVFHVFSNLSKILLFRNGVEKNLVLKLGIPAVIFVAIGALITSFFPTKQIELVMNLVLVFLSVYLLLNSKKQLKQTDANLYFGGIMSGFIAGVAGTGGAIRGSVLSAFQLRKDVFIATSAMIDLGVDFSRAAVYISNGYFNSEHLFLIPFLIGIGFLGTYFGKFILGYTSEVVFKYIVIGVIISTAIFQIIRYFFDF